MGTEGKIIKRMAFDPEFRPIQLGPVVKARVMSAYEEAKRILLQARQEAKKIRQEAAQVLVRAETERKEERRLGYEKGREEGFAELSEKIWAVEQEREKILAEAEPQVIRMVMDIAEKVIGRAIERGAIVDVVKQAISQAVGKKLVVRLNPADVATVREKERELMKELDQRQSVNVREDEEVAQGGCIVESEMGTVDARLETQLAAIKKALGLDVV